MMIVNIRIGKDLPETKRWDCIAWGWVGMDPESGAYLTRSNGRHKAGRKTTYFVTLDNLTIKIRAYSDNEAAQIANHKLNE